jgi:hypothetical protein
MKQVSCDVIQDLIPLYVEDMLSEDSKILVETHLDECEECREYLNELQEITSIPLEADVKPLRNIQATLQKKKWQAIILAALITLLIGTLTVVFMTAPDYLPYSEEVVTVSETADELVLVDFNDDVAGYNLDSSLNENGTGTVYHLTTWTSTWRKLEGREEIGPIVLNPNQEPVEAVYYYQTNGEADQLIYGEEQHPSGGMITLPRLSLTYFSGLALIVLLMCIGIMFVVRSNKIHFERMVKITGLPIAYLLAQFIVTGWNTTTYSMVRDFTAILLVCTLLYGIFWIGMKLVKNHFVK